jgi:pimeloyl-ACP methyl ester carboxylesterase
VRRPLTLAGTLLAAGSLVTAVLIATPSAGAAPSGAGTVAAQDGSDPARSPFGWKPCDDPDLAAAGAKCGSLSVPLDHARPNGPRIRIALSRVKHTVPDTQYQGVMLVNPGGPGASGLGLATLGQYVPGSAGGAYDWIGFDPRGVGSSQPALSCIADYSAGPRPAYVPTTPTLERTWLGRVQRYAAACGARGGALLPYLRTVDVARDLELVRAALNAPQLNFYGFSYGTYLGQVYATLFPQRVRRMVLDSNVDPRTVFYQANLDQDVPFQRNMEAWWAWVARYDAVYHLGTTEKAVEKAWWAEGERLAATPAGGKVGPSEWNDIFLTAGYAQPAWPYLATLWQNWATTHDATDLLTEYGNTESPTDDNMMAAYNGVQCVDGVWPRDWATWRTDAWRMHDRAPYTAWGNTWFNAPCQSWPVKGSPPVDVTGRRVAPVLLIDETLDAATPFSGSLEVRRRFPAARLIALPGGTNHAFSLFGNSCLDDQIAAYLADGTLPARKPGAGPDTSCDPLPTPDPTSAATASVARTATPDKYRTLDKLLHGHRI